MRSAKKTPAKPQETSRQKLLRSAERLFADHGFDGVSVRDIANDAKVNSALIGYYFGGKEGLLAEVYTSHCEPLRMERTRLLEKAIADGRVATLEEVLDAFIRPSLEATRNRKGVASFSRLRTILSVENSALLEQLVAQNFDDSSRMFVEALCRCLPHLSHEDVFWRFHFLLGAIYYTASGPHRIRALSAGKCDPSEPSATREQLIAFASAGFLAATQEHSAKAPSGSSVARSKQTKAVPASLRRRRS